MSYWKAAGSRDLDSHSFKPHRFAMSERWAKKASKHVLREGDPDFLAGTENAFLLGQKIRIGNW